MFSNYLLSVNNKILFKLPALFCLMMFIIQNTQAQVYKCEKESGNITFSDEPCTKGETSSRLNWLKNATKPKKRTTSNTEVISSRAKKLAKKARKENESYVLLSLLTTTQLELETASLRSSYKGEKTTLPELILPDGVVVDLLKVDTITVVHKYGKGEINVLFTMNDGYEEVKVMTKPYPVISGEAKIGRFSKSLGDIKRIDFFNSNKLLNDREKNRKQESVASSKLSAPARSKRPSVAKQKSFKTHNDVPVIELDLSEQVSDKKKTTGKISVKPQIKVAKKPGQSKIKPGTSGVQVSLVNDKIMILQNSGLESSKDGQKSRAKHFMVSDDKQIPYKEIKRIKVRPTANQSSLLVAIELKTKEIKMEVMTPPFTRLIGKSQSGSFDYSLLEIKSISFQ